MSDKAKKRIFKGASPPKGITPKRNQPEIKNPPKPKNPLLHDRGGKGKLPVGKGGEKRRKSIMDKVDEMS